MAQLSIQSNAEEIAKEIEKLQKEAVKEVKTFAKKYLNAEITKLQARLSDLVNIQIRDQVKIPGQLPQSTAQRISQDQIVGKSRLTSSGQDWHSSPEDPIINVFSVNGGNDLGAKVRYDLSGNSNYDDYLEQFKSSLATKTFAIPDDFGNKRYYTLKPDMLDDALDNVKIFCSEFRADAGWDRDDGDPLKDIGRTAGLDKFRRDRDKGFTEFTLKSDFIKAIQERGSDVTEAITSSQFGEYEQAAALLKGTPGPAAAQMAQRAEDAAKGQGLSDDSKALNTTNQAITNISLEERVNGDNIKYIVKTLLDDKVIIGQEILNVIKRESVIWSSEQEGPFTTQIEQAWEKAIQKLKGS